MRFLSLMVLLVFISPAIALPPQSNCVQLDADGNCAIYGALAINNSSSLGIFDPFWDRNQWQWEDVSGWSEKLLKHKTAKDCYISADSPGEVLTDNRVTRGKKMLSGSLYEVIRTYDENNASSEVYYIKEVQGEIDRVFAVFVGEQVGNCLAKAEDILNAYELHQTKQMQSNAQHNASVGTSAFLISRESIETSKPERVAITSIKKTDRGARIVAFSYANAAISTFLRQLEKAGATNLQLLEIKPLTACGRRVTRAEFQIDGDTSYLVEANSSTEQLDLLFGGNNKVTQCLSSVHM